MTGIRRVKLARHIWNMPTVEIVAGRTSTAPRKGKRIEVPRRPEPASDADKHIHTIYETSAKSESNTLGNVQPAWRMNNSISQYILALHGRLIYLPTFASAEMISTSFRDDKSICVYIPRSLAV